MNSYLSKTIVAFLISVLLSPISCVQKKKDAPPQEPQFTKVIAQKTSMPVKIDGILDDEIWKSAPIHTAAFDKRRQDAPQEPGTVQFAWDDKNLYMAVKFVDTDIVAEGEEDQLHHYKMGDLAELFLKPENSTWYWELYVTPHGRKTSFWFPGRGRFGLESGFQYKMELQVGARIEGTLNDWRDKDSYWTGEMAVPVSELTKYGDSFGPGSDWRVFLGRYNLSRYLSRQELSMFPSLRWTDYHLHEDYGVLEFAE